LNPPDRIECANLLSRSPFLFVATAALGPGPALSALKMGALVSVGGAALACVAAAALRTGRFAAHHADR
jgi:hypothetical protein